MNEEYINAAIQEILRIQNLNGNFNLNNAGNIGLSQQSLDQQIINQLLDIRNLDIKGQYVVDSRGNEVPIVERVKGTILTREGYPVNFEKERFHTMDDGTSLGEFAECMNCGRMVSKTNLFQCSGCGKTVCRLCGSHSSSGEHYCGFWCSLFGG